jgi:hypothetical protein
MLVLILDRTAAIERIVALATEPRVPAEFMLSAAPRAAFDFVTLGPVPYVERAVPQREPALAGARYVAPEWC